MRNIGLIPEAVIYNNASYVETVDGAALGDKKALARCVLDDTPFFGKLKPYQRGRKLFGVACIIQQFGDTDPAEPIFSLRDVLHWLKSARRQAQSAARFLRLGDVGAFISSIRTVLVDNSWCFG